jgi:hypothetical protein
MYTEEGWYGMGMKKLVCPKRMGCQGDEKKKIYTKEGWYRTGTNKWYDLQGWDEMRMKKTWCMPKRMVC